MAARKSRPSINTLCIDIGGSGLKASVVNDRGVMLSERVRVDTPQQARAADVVKLLVALVKPLPAWLRVSVGFPGVVRHGRVLTAPNLGTEAWRGFNLATALEKALKAPVRVANDADVQGFGAIRGSGLEMVVTLGTGFGTALYLDGKLCPHLEVSHSQFRKGETFDPQVGNAGRKAVGDERWNKRVQKAIEAVRSLTNFDHIYIGGGNAKRITFKLGKDMTIVDNDAGMIGGIGLWKNDAP